MEHHAEIASEPTKDTAQRNTISPSFRGGQNLSFQLAHYLNALTKRLDGEEIAQPAAPSCHMNFLASIDRSDPLL